MGGTLVVTSSTHYAAALPLLLLKSTQLPQLLVLLIVLSYGKSITDTNVLNA
jgi:hypothetical protein